MRPAFTLFEVAVALAMATTAVLTAAVVFPTGVRAQQAARFRLYAATKAMEISEPALDHEVCASWDVGYSTARSRATSRARSRVTVSACIRCEPAAW